MSRKPLYIFILTLFYLSCSKDEGGKTVLNGLVQDDTNDEPIAFVNLYVERQDKDCVSCVATIEETTKTNNDGGFNFNFDASGDYDYFVRAAKTGYYINLAIPRVQIETGEGSTPVLRLQPEGYVRLFLKNTSPLNAADEISVVGGGTYVGMTVDTTDVIVALGNRSNIVQWIVTRNSSPSSFSTQIQAVSFDTVNYTINY